MAQEKPMRDFTPEEKKKIVSTPITLSSFDLWTDYHYEEVRIEHFPHPHKANKTCTMTLYPTSVLESLATDCEAIRRKYIETRQEHYFEMLVALLPASYKVVSC